MGRECCTHVKDIKYIHNFCLITRDRWEIIVLNGIFCMWMVLSSHLTRATEENNENFATLMLQPTLKNSALPEYTSRMLQLCKYQSAS